MSKIPCELIPESPDKKKFVALTIQLDPVDMAVLEIFAFRAGIAPERLASGLFKEALHRSEEAYCRIVDCP